MSSHYREFVLPYAEPGLALNPPVLDPSVYPNSALRSPYPIQTRTTPLATAHLPLLRLLASSATSLTEIFNPVITITLIFETALK